MSVKSFVVYWCNRSLFKVRKIQIYRFKTIKNALSTLCSVTVLPFVLEGRCLLNHL